VKYLLKARNPQSGKIEAYEVELASPDEILMVLDFWGNGAGYEIISMNPA